MDRIILLDVTENTEPESVESTATPAPQSEQTTQSEGIPFLWIVIAVAAVVLALCLTAIIIIARKKGKKQVKKDGNTVKIIKSSTAICPIKIANVHNIGKRESQQDSFGISSIDNFSQKGILALVADGMGGLEAGAESSSTITNYFLSAFKSCDMEGINSSDLLLSLLKSSNEKLVKVLKESNVTLGGTTLVATIIKDNLMSFISVGDSRIALIRSDSLTVLNREHTYAVELDEKVLRGEISLSDAKNNPERKSLTSYVGMETIKYVDRSLKPIPLIKGDKILLMSDGVFGSLKDEEIVSTLSGSEIYDCAVNLEKLILEKAISSQDNFTAIIIEID